MPPRAPDFELVRQRLIKTRKERAVSLRGVSEETQVSAATLSRFESQKGNPDVDTLFKLAEWLDLDRTAVFGSSGDDELANLGTPEKVEVHLRADPKLDPRTARALAQGFRALYEQFTDDESSRDLPRRA